MVFGYLFHAWRNKLILLKTNFLLFFDILLATYVGNVFVSFIEKKWLGNYFMGSEQFLQWKHNTEITKDKCQNKITCRKKDRRPMPCEASFPCRIKLSKSRLIAVNSWRTCGCIVVHMPSSLHNYINLSFEALHWPISLHFSMLWMHVLV